MNDQLQDHLNFAIKATQASSKTTLGYFAQSINYQCKDDGTPVTIADRNCETHLRNQIQAAYPNDSILGEEFDSVQGSSGYEWVIDPIDGTISFVQGVPLYGTMLGCIKDGQPILGVIVMPALNETVYAAKGLGCWHTTKNSAPKRVHVSTNDKIDESIINTTSMSYFTTEPQRDLYNTLDQASKYTRGWSDCYGFVLLATGRVDAIIEPFLNLWDYAAAIPIIQESGAIWSDFANNQSLDTVEMIAANPQIHAQIMDLITPELHSRNRLAFQTQSS